MKTRILVIASSILLLSCDILVIEPQYDERDRIAGSYVMKEYSQTYNESAQYNVYVRKTGSVYSNDVTIENFYNANVDVWAEMIGDKIYISRQVVNGYEIEGVGTIYYDEIRFNYSVKDLYYKSPLTFVNLKPDLTSK